MKEVEFKIKPGNFYCSVKGVHAATVKLTHYQSHEKQNWYKFIAGKNTICTLFSTSIFERRIVLESSLETYALNTECNPHMKAVVNNTVL